MSDVKRYAPCSHDYEAIMEESAHGGYVRGRDYEELARQVEALEAERKTVIDYINKHIKRNRDAAKAAGTDDGFAHFDGAAGALGDLIHLFQPRDYGDRQ